MKNREQDQREAILLLQAQPASASLWLRSGADLPSLFGRLPDPAFSESQNWPVYAWEPSEPVSVQTTITPGSAATEQPGIPTHEAGEQIPFFASNTGDQEPAITTKDSTMETPITATDAEKSAKQKRKRDKKTRKGATPDGPAEDFFDWLRMHPVNGGASKSAKKASGGKKSRKAEAKGTLEAPALTAAEQSTVLGDAVVSETLARLLARQGHAADAIAMYEKLMEKYPGKRANFAAAIEKLKS